MIIPPSNIILLNQYTSGGEFIYASSYLPYQGYYYELNGKFFAGKTFNSNSLEIIKINSENINILLTQQKTYDYGVASKNKIVSEFLPFYVYDGESSIRYFSSKINTNPPLIKEVSKKTFENFQSNPLYVFVNLSYNYRTGFNFNELNKAENIIKGITEFITNLGYNPNNDVDTYLEGQG